MVVYVRREPNAESLLVLLNFDDKPASITVDLSFLGQTDTLSFDALLSERLIPTPQPSAHYTVELAPLSGNILPLDQTK